MAGAKEPTTSVRYSRLAPPALYVGARTAADQNAALFLMRLAGQRKAKEVDAEAAAFRNEGPLSSIASDKLQKTLPESARSTLKPAVAQRYNLDAVLPDPLQRELLLPLGIAAWGSVEPRADKMAAAPIAAAMRQAVKAKLAEIANPQPEAAKAPPAAGPGALPPAAAPIRQFRSPRARQRPAQPSPQ